MPSKKTPKKKKKFKLSLSGVLVAFCFILAGISIWFAGASANRVEINDNRIATDDKLLKDYLRTYGPEKAIALIKSNPEVDCHQRVHKIGRLNYELANVRAFSVLNSECMSGYTHGVTEAFFKEHGTADLQQNLKIICPGDLNGFYAHQCFHGIGHGLMAYTDYDLPDALKLCDMLPDQQSSFGSCYSGVFMENVVGAIGIDEAKQKTDLTDTHVSSYLNNNPHYPCTVVAEKYKDSCYIFQTSRMVQLFSYDYKKVAEACGEAEADYQFSCFISMGRDVSNSAASNYSQVETDCSYPKDKAWQNACIAGASQDRFWDITEQDDAIGLCAALKEQDFKSTCYTELTLRAKDIVSGDDDKQSFCRKYEPDFKNMCTI